MNGWTVGSAFGDRAFFKGDWLLRAAAARAGIYGNDAVEAMYPATKTEPSGEPIDTSKYRYTLTFPKGQLPPVKAFWSVTMYDAKNQLLVDNPHRPLPHQLADAAVAQEGEGRLDHPSTSRRAHRGKRWRRTGSPPRMRRPTS